MPANSSSECRVFWLIQAHDQLRSALNSAGTAAADLENKLRELNEKLRATFPQADGIVVLERLGGYSITSHKHVLRVEVSQGVSTLARVVKIRSADKLAEELKGWQDCRQAAQERGRSFMKLQEGARVDGKLQSLIYEDAYETLRAAELVNLEQAVLNCCRWKVPSVTSILAVLDLVFAELIDRLYAHAHTVALTAADADQLRQRLGPGYDGWRSTATVAGGARANAIGSIPREPFVDLCAFYDQAFSSFSTDMFPEIQRGPAHGDLHGRNVLVGLVDGEARWPAVYDYEDMGLNNDLCWDFAKLETELKVRVLSHVYPEDTQQFINKTHQFETRLNQETERLNNVPFEEWTQRGLNWQATNSPEERLLLVLLEIRRQAKKSLEHVVGRGRRWLHEHYFALACYAVYAGRFQTLRTPECTALYVSGSLAAARYLWSVSRSRFNAEDATHQARNAIAFADSEARRSGPPHVGPKIELAFAQEFVRSRQVPFVKAAIEILNKLLERVTHIPEIWQELALAHLELGSLETSQDATCCRKALAILREFDAAQDGLYTLDAETLARSGRIWKQLGHRASDASQCDDARKHYEVAMRYYERAFELHPGDYYTGVNAATLRLLADPKQKDAVRQAAEKLWALVESTPKEKQDVWFLATQGEVTLLQDKHRPAAVYYSAAINDSACTPHAAAVMLDQVKRLIQVLADKNGDFKDLLERGVKNSGTS